jgi:methionyl-tRNA formyltransferase
MKPLRVVFMGTPEFALLPLEKLYDSGHQIVAVYTQRDKAAGRGRMMSESPVKTASVRMGLQVVQPRSFRDPAVVAALAALKPDVIVVAAYGLILPPEVLAVPSQGCLNIHPSLLPRYRGVSPIPAAILNGDEFTGVSIMLLDAGTDTGPLLGRLAVPVSQLDTTGSLTAKLSRLGACFLLDLLPRWTGGQITPRPQDNLAATYCGKITKEEGVIDWAQTADEISRRVRAYDPWPGARTTWQGKVLKIVEASPLVGITAGPGQVIAANDKGTAFGVGTGKGVLGVTTVQLEGKRAMSAAEFLRGQRGFIGSILPS